MSKISTIILAAGKGTRMPSSRPKALQTVLGEAMISHVYHAVKQLSANIWTVIGHGADEVSAHINKTFGEKAFEHCVLQDKQLGTGHAVQCALQKINEILNIKNLPQGTKILVVNADTPLINEDILREFIEKANNIPLAFMSLTLEDPAAYGRVVRMDFDANVNSMPLGSCNFYDANTGSVQGIIEAKDFKKKFPDCEIHEVNAGIYLFDSELLEKLLPQISTANESGEYYLTDIIALAKENSYKIEAISLGSSSLLLGVNNPLDLHLAEKFMQEEETKKHMKAGVIIHAPESVRISPLATIKPGVELFGPCEIYGQSYIDKDTIIESHCYINNTHISEACTIRSFCHFEDAIIANSALIGPYARLRPKTVLADNVRIGNFVEIKKSTVGKGSKINHLSYIGDSLVGSDVNIGAGCITCNYDGKNKHQTIIGDNAFLGSDSSFVAPVKIGKNALIGAGSVITHDVPDDSLAIARQKQSILKKVVIGSDSKK